MAQRIEGYQCILCNGVIPLTPPIQVRWYKGSTYHVDCLNEALTERVEGLLREINRLEEANSALAKTLRMVMHKGE